MSEEKYTLAEARDILRAAECAMHGHDFDVVTNGMDKPTAIICSRCGKSWAMA